MIITGGKYKSRKMLVPDESITRPTLSKIRMGVFNTLFSLIGNFEGKSFLDLFGGSGIMGIEALSRGFSNITVFEKNSKAVQIIKKNYELLGLKPNLKIGDSLILLKTLDKDFDVVYLDPPYQSGFYEKVFKLLNNVKVIIAEHPADLKIDTNFELIKTKNYGGKCLSFYKKSSEPVVSSTN